MHDYKKYGNKVLAMYFISSTELTNPTIDINPTLLLPYYPFGFTLQQCRVYVNCRVCQFCRAYEVHSQHLVSVLFIVMHSSLHHSHLLFSGGVAKDGKNDPLPNKLTTPTATQQDSFFLSVYC